jgi:hypothetical protein
LRFPNLSRVVLAFVLAAALPSSAQTNPRLPNYPLDQEKSGPSDETRLRLERDMAKKANLARQAEIKRDTEKLLKLANELKEFVDKTNASQLSVDVVKKAEEIEKLAHSVKDKMKGGY